MNKALLALVLLGFAAAAQAQFDYDVNFAYDGTAVTGNGEWSGYIERGVDCGNTFQSGKNPARECTCFTDLTRDRVPPTLLNNGVDRDGTDTRAGRETGIVKTASVGDDAQLEVAVALDFGTFYSGHPDLSGLTTGDGSAPVLRQFNGLSNSVGTTFHNGAYKVPHLAFFTKDGEGKDQEQPNCRWAAGTEAGYALATLEAGTTPDYESGVSGNAYADCDTGSDNTNRPILSVRKEVRAALNECGFTTATGQDAAANGITQPGGAVVPDDADGNGGSTFTIYTGTFKVTQWRQGGSLNDAEVAKKEEYPFTIQLAFPENIQVTSEVISVIGKAEYQSTITHSIYESETGKEYVNVNALFGTTFPFAVSETATFNGGADVYSLKLKADSPACAGFASAKAPNGVDANTDADNLLRYNTYCVSGGTPITSQTQDNYRLAEPVLCDLNDNGVCDIEDVFTVVEDGVLFKGKAETQAFFGLDTGGSDFSPAGSALVAARCTGNNYGGGATATVNGMACLQNMGMRLKPKGWCDLNANLEITINTVCRDDANGDDTKDDSLIDGTTLDQDGDSVYSIINTPNAPNPFLPTSDNNVLKQSEGGADLECKSSQYAEQQDPKHVLTFSLRSDDFCPRVVATADVTASMAVYPSELGAASWGADLLREAADLDAVNAIITNDNGLSGGDAAALKTDFNCVTLQNDYAGTPENAADAFITNPLCRQVPLLSDTRVTEDAFVYGTTAYLETTLDVEAGVNIASSKIQELYVSNAAVTLGDSRTFPTAADINDADDLTTAGTRVGSPNAAENDWLKQLMAGNAVVGGQQSWRTDIKSGSDLVLTPSQAEERIQFSDELTTNSMLKTFVAGTPDVRNAQAYNFFAANPCANNANAPEACANQGVAYEGVSRVSVFLDDYTVYISDDAREAPENIKFWAQVAITYKAADQQGDLTSKTSSTVPSGSADRARLMAAAAATGSQASAQGSMSVSGQAGSGGSSSTIAGFSSTTVLAVAAVLGAVVVAAGASFFVVRKRNAAAKSAKRSSSSTELNDTLAVQA